MNFRLIEASDECFSWLLGEADAPAGLRVPPGGVDEPAVISYVRNTAARVRETWRAGCWMVVADAEVVGLCSYKTPPDRDGLVEIGYGIAVSRRRRGHATRAVRELILLSATRAEVRGLVAETEASNVASRRVLLRHGFEETGHRSDPEHGERMVWRRDLPGRHGYSSSRRERTGLIRQEICALSLPPACEGRASDWFWQSRP